MSEIEQNDLIDRVAAELRKPVAIDRAFDARLMAAVRAEARPARPARGGSPALVAAWRWLARPRTISLSPVAGLAIAAGVAGVALLAARDRGAGSAAVLPASSSSAAVPVSSAADAPPAAGPARVMQLFVYVGPHVSSVALVGDFNDWDPSATPMQPSAAGVWSVNFALAPGRHEYAFVVDGKRWVIDPAATPAPAGDFGSPNSVITIADATS